MVRQKPTMIAAVLAIGIAAGAAEAQPFQMVSDGADGTWVLDEGSGAVTWCRLVTAPGAKLIDVFGADAQVRETPARPAEPRCEQVRGPSATADRLPLDVLALLDGYDSDGYDPVYAPWWGNNFGWRRHPGDVGGRRDRNEVDPVRPMR
jgi:hypothetical protein